MLVQIFRAHEYDKREIDVKLIDTTPGSVRWTKDRGLNGGHISIPNYILQCYIDYSVADKLGLISGEHRGVGIAAKVFLYKKDNTDPAYREGYKYLCELAGEKPGW